MAKTRQRSVFLSVLFVLLVIWVAVMVLLFAWAIITSLKDKWDFKENVLGLPEAWHFKNYIEVFKSFYVKVVNEKGTSYAMIWHMALNSVLYAGGSALLAAGVPALTAYACSRFNFKFNKVIYGTVIVLMILPVFGTTAATLDILRSLGIYDTIPGQWILNASGIGVNVLIYGAAFGAVPKAISEAAEIDGASQLRILFRIMFPLILPTYYTLFLTSFVAFWNNYEVALIMIPSFPTLSYGLYSFNFSSETDLSSAPMKLAGVVVVMLPILLVFVLTHKKLMMSASVGGVKG